MGTVTSFSHMTRLNQISYNLCVYDLLSTLAKGDTKRVNEYRRDTMGRLRKERRRILENAERERNRRCMSSKDGCPSYWYLETYPDATAADILAWAMENVWMDCAPSMYDCTGKSFSHELKCFQAGKNVVLYHYVGMDV